MCSGSHTHLACKENLPVLLPVIHSIVNKSLQESTISSPLKRALVKPLIKKPSLDKENLKNYRPVSNLPYIGKLIEKAAIKQINEHLTENNLHESLQSAYTTNHSTETALLKVTNDIFYGIGQTSLCISCFIRPYCSLLYNWPWYVFETACNGVCYNGRSSHMDAIVPCK